MGYSWPQNCPDHPGIQITGSALPTNHCVTRIDGFLLPFKA